MTEEPPARPPSMLHRARLEDWALIAQIVSAVAVVISLVFVGIQLNDANRVAARAEANSTQEQWTAFNASIYSDRDTARVFHAAVTGAPLDAVDRLRFAYLLREQGWLTYQGWERVRAGLRPRASFYEGSGVDLVRIICTPGGRATWVEVRREFPPAYVKELEALMPSQPGTCPLTAGDR